MKNFFLYITITISILYIAILYNSKTFLVLVGIAVLLPPFFLCMLWKIEKKIKCELFFPSYLENRRCEYIVGLQVENKSTYYLTEVCTKIVLQNLGTKEKYKVKVKGTVGAQEKVMLSTTLRQPEFGLWQIECNYVCCYDWFRIFYLKKRLKEQKQIMVFPACYETNVEVGIRTKLSLSDGELYHPMLSGDDSTEIFKLREYKMGDRINRIHWKLSAKNDNLIVAEMSMPIGCNVVCFLDAEIKNMSRVERTVYWEVVNTLSQKMLEQKCYHFLVWMEQEMLHRKAIQSPEDLSEFWNEILQSEMKRCEFFTMYEQEFRGDIYTSAICWDQDLNLYCNHKLIKKIIPQQIEKQLLELELIV